MQKLPEAASLIGLKVKHGSPGYEQPEVIDDVAFFQSTGRAHVIFKSCFSTNMTLNELAEFIAAGEVHYSQHFRNEKDTGLAVLKADN